MTTRQLTVKENAAAVWHGHPITADKHPALVYLASLANDRVRIVQRQALDVIAGIIAEGYDALSFPWPDLRYPIVAAIRAKLAEDYSPATANRLLSALRQTARECWRLGYISSEEMALAIDVKNVKGETLPAGRSLAAGELAALMADCAADETPAGARDAAMIAVLYQGGLRRAEVVSLDRADYDVDTGEIRLMGKGRKQRTAYLTNGGERAMVDWLAIRGNEAGPLFCRIRKGGALQKGKRLSGQAIFNMLRKHGGRAGVKDFSPHDLRRSFISDLLDAGADIATVQRMAGHASVNTTSRYDRRPEQAKQKAAGLLHVPYNKD